MSELDLSWLNSLEVKDGEKGRKKVKKMPKKPKVGDILILKNGSVYYSDDFKTLVGKTFADLVFLSEWFEAKTDQEGMLFVMLPEGTAKASIKNKIDTKITFIKDQFIPALKEKMDIDVEALGSIELAVAVDNKIELGNGIYHFQKKISGGKAAGKYEPKRRENVDIYPMALVKAEVTTDATQQELPFDKDQEDQIEVDSDEVTVD